MARFIIVAVLTIITVFAFTRVEHPLRIDTDLKNLSPALSDDLAMQDAVDALSRALESRMMLVFASEDASLPPRVASQVAEALSDQTTVTSQVGNALPEPLIDLFAAHRFQLLSDDQRATLADDPDSVLIERATRRLYEPGDSSRALPFEQDPLGFFQDYLIGLGSDAETGSTPDGEFIAVVNLHLGDNPLDRDFQAMFSARLAEVLDEVARQHPEVAVYRSGIFLFAEQAARTARNDISLISTVSTVAVILLMLIAFRSLRPMMLATLSIVLGIGFAFVATHLLFGKVHIITLVFGVGLIGIVIDYALHYSYHQTWSAPGHGHGKLFAAMALSLGSSLIGYGALGFSELPALGRVAVFSCVGLATAWCSVIALGSWLGRGKPDHRSALIAGSNDGVRRLADAVAGRPRVLFAGLTIALLVLLLGGVTGNDSPRALFDPDPALIAEEVAVTKRTSRFEPGQYFIVRADSEAALFERISRLETASGEGLFSIADFLPSAETQYENHALQRRLYETDGTVSQFLESLGAGTDIATALAGEYRDATDKQLTAQAFNEAAGNHTPPLVLVQPDALYSFALVSDVDAITSARSIAAGDKNIAFIDTAAMTSTALGNQRRAALWLLALGFGLSGCCLSCAIAESQQSACCWFRGFRYWRC